MKVARCNDGSNTFWAVIDPDGKTARPLAGAITDWAPGLTANPGGPLPFAGPARPLDGLRLLAPLEPTARIPAVGATYAKHVAGLGLKMPKQPAAFLKPVSSLVGPQDELNYPAITKALDYEGELVVIVGAKVESPDRAIEAILGYTIGNEVSARDLQFGGSVTGMDLFSGKALDSTGSLGPWIVTRDEFGDRSPDLELEVTVNGERRQHERTGNLVWGVGELLAYVDARMSVRPGDVMFTGTPAGVGHEDGRYLEPGQVVTVTIERMGSLTNTVGARR